MRVTVFMAGFAGILTRMSCLMPVLLAVSGLHNLLLACCQAKGRLMPAASNTRRCAALCAQTPTRRSQCGLRPMCALATSTRCSTLPIDKHFIWVLFHDQKRSSVFSTHIQRQLLFHTTSNWHATCERGSNHLVHQQRDCDA
jgi:hypothetical protein